MSTAPDARTAPARFASPADLLGAAGTALGPGDWFAIDQARIDAFADATDDHQWIHVDVERAAAGPFGAPIAHGFLTLSLLTALAGPLLAVDGVAMGVNYGFEKVRFLQPVTVGSRVRAVGSIASAEQTGTGIRVVQDLAIEIEGAGRPALVAQWVTLIVPG
ncbi:MaoC family dehydratase [Agromyces intestinalis]|uniref:MaoC family dehydratase n=1 Tax=Agromyces intestinalis TaxID=2592652 RepID=A0A5C1YHA3_9MICO|nr:MaoC family dehydratase [Agromyces intestinalis]QEO14988.1 MaoC family dehydratase [Agromyces intestinalis]